MKTEIRVRGQINGNSVLCRAIQTHNCDVRSTNFYGYCLTFPTKKAAKKALWDGYKFLKSQEPDFAKGGIRYSKYGTLSYDASKAEIVD